MLDATDLAYLPVVLEITGYARKATKAIPKAKKKHKYK
jgi:hypothetical protein